MLRRELRAAPPAVRASVADRVGADPGRCDGCAAHRPADGAAPGFEREVYVGRRDRLVTELDGRKDKLLREVSVHAKTRGLALVQGPGGLSVMPLDPSGNVMPPDEFAKLSEKEQEVLREQLEELEDELEATLRQVRAVDVEGGRQIKQLERDAAAAEIAARIVPVREDSSPWTA